MNTNVSSNVIAFGDKRLNSIQVNFEQLKRRAREQFILTQKSIPSLIGCYDEPFWRYRGENIYFSSMPDDSRAIKDRVDWPDEITELVKALIINKLYKIRTRKELLSASLVQGLRKPIPSVIESGITGLDRINSDSYQAAYDLILSSYGNPVTRLQEMNLFFEFLGDSHVLQSIIDFRRPNKDPRVQDKIGPTAKHLKMPLPELVRAIIQLRWKVEEMFDGTDRMTSDLLGIYTQVFSYALGLRIGEILRIPEDCLFWDGPDLRCRIWTEKGHQARAPYVPTLWREPIIQTVDRIKALTKKYREHAREFEERQRMREVEDRIRDWQIAREIDAQSLENELRTFLDTKRVEAEQAWELLSPVDPEAVYPLREIASFLPIAPSQNMLNSHMASRYKEWGLKLTETPIIKGGVNKRYSATGQAILDFVIEQIEIRANNITEWEFLCIVHGRTVHRKTSGDKSISALTKIAPGKSATCYTFSPDTFAGKGSAPSIMSKEAAAKKLKDYAHGGFDIYSRMDVLSFQELFPEIPFINSRKKSKDGQSNSIQNRNPLFKINEKQKLYVKVRTEDSYIRYSVNPGYTLDIESIHSMLFETFTSDNLAIEKEIWEQDHKDKEEEAQFTGTAVTISSRSFSVQQNVSDFLFLRSRIMSANSNPFVPQILSYSAVFSAMKGSEKNQSNFERYGIDISDEVCKTWSTHQGRHWKTTSMLRAGLEEEIVNRYMGREGSQLEHYDHSTGTERAQQVGEAMREDQTRYLGEVPNVVRRMQTQNIPIEQIDDYLNETMSSVQHIPCGMCIGSLNANPCQYNMGCLIGNQGNGCSRYIFDTKDPVMRATLANERDKSEREISRLLDVYDAGNPEAEKHIMRHAKLVENISTVFSAVERLLEAPAQKTTEIAPFENHGSVPDDSPFGFGD